MPGEGQPTAVNIFVRVLTNENTGRESEAPAQVFSASRSAPSACERKMAARQTSVGTSLSRYRLIALRKDVYSNGVSPLLKQSLVLDPPSTIDWSTRAAFELASIGHLTQKKSNVTDALKMCLFEPSKRIALFRPMFRRELAEN